ncbi:MAG: DUF2268 domain-containing putative Zn-dependent protease [bacterium]
MHRTAGSPAVGASASFDAFLAAVSLRDSAATRIKSSAPAAGATLYLRAATVAPDAGGPGQSYYDAADAFAAATMLDAASTALDSAIAHNYHDSAALMDSVFTALRGTSHWSVLLKSIAANERRYRDDHSDPDRARITTSDIPRFWHAFDLAASAPTPEARADIFLHQYIEPGSRGLRDFYALKIRSPKRLADAAQQYPAFYAAVRSPTLRLADLEPTVRTVFRRMKELYPATIYPDLYFVVGRVSSAGTATDYGLLFGAEQNVGSPDIPLGELSEPLQRIVFPRADLPRTIAHELVHFQQRLAGKHTLLDVALIEGGASFLADLAMPGVLAPHYLTWGGAHERDVWTRFAREMNADDVADWIGNNGTTGRAAWPADLGYFVGYEISKAYYERAANKQDAIRDLILLVDSEAVLRQSHYADRFTM